MAAILRRTTPAVAASSVAALLQRPPSGAARLAWFLGAGASAPSHDAGTAAPATEFVPWRNGGGVLHRAATFDPTAVVEAGAVIGREVVVGSGTVVGPSVS